MGIDVDVIVPAAAWDDPARLAARQWTVAWWQDRGYHVTVAELADRPWSKGAAVNDAIAASTARVIVVADADVFTASDQIDKAVKLAAGGQWCVPFDTVRRLDPPSTAEVLARPPALTERPTHRNLAQPPHDALPGGGIIAAHANLWSAVGGFDPRFVDWGGEDYALGLAMRTLQGAPARTLPGDLWHLWHPPQPNTGDESQATAQLAMRYRTALHRPDAMRALIGEWRQPWPRST